ncbi:MULTISPECIES: type II toxin-antitoxin system VapC family toxin [Pseudanabaena]|jgi:predicted nucleic acid-binding protein|uniref:type II toxin-antitoxin system VapC family toxin n=1 Tax=Pseudanabaena TaxID=1152 RepID=UPI002478A22B|nr:MULTISPECIES: PIN domain-containing protein [Pseudanabaena]MEA5486033.1 PIN domain-containing protein [Pseudanabaena sp. CCNP1317]WGS73033.1 PIN domain-containing protein [Pseudanabaena galeata CCNP1313]
MKVLIDTNVLLDFLLEREPFKKDAEELFAAIISGQIIGYVTATTLTDIFYIARKHTRNLELAREAVSSTLDTMTICPINRNVLEAAFASGLTDFEDAVQIYSAIAQNLDAIVTRDAKGFASSTIPVYSVQELLKRL